jgi:hypothetical protein
VENSEDIFDKNGLIEYIKYLGVQLKENPDRFENVTLDRFFLALAGWLEDSDGWHLNRGEPLVSLPSWGFVGDMMSAALVYE